MQKRPRKHHYLPEFYTQRWTDSGGEMVRFIRKPSGEIERRRVTPGGIGFERDLYTISEDAEADEQALELGLFRLVDDFGGKTTERLLAGDIPSDSEGRSKWAAFVLSLMFRCPKDIRARSKAYEILVRKMFPEEPPNELAARQIALQQLWRGIDNSFLGGVLVRMQWDVVDLSDSGVPLLTSDNPIIMSNGLAPPEGNYALPLSPTHMFVMSWPGPQRSNALAAPHKVLAKLANKNTVERARLFVIDKSEGQRSFIEKHFAARPVPSPLESLAIAYAGGKFPILDPR